MSILCIRKSFFQQILIVLFGALSLQVCMPTLYAMKAPQVGVHGADERGDRGERGILDKHLSEWGCKEVCTVFFVFVILGFAILIPLISVSMGAQRFYDSTIVRDGRVCNTLDSGASMCCGISQNSLLECCVNESCTSVELKGAPNSAYVIGNRLPRISKKFENTCSEYDTYGRVVGTLKGAAQKFLASFSEEASGSLSSSPYNLYSCIMKTKLLSGYSNRLNSEPTLIWNSDLDDRGLGACINGTLEKIQATMPGLRGRKIGFVVHATKGNSPLWSQVDRTRVMKNNFMFEMIKYLLWRDADSIDTEERLGVQRFIGANYQILRAFSTAFTDDVITKILAHEMAHFTQSSEHNSQNTEIKSLAEWQEYVHSNNEFDADLKAELVGSSVEPSESMAAALVALMEPSETTNKNPQICIDHEFDCLAYKVKKDKKSSLQEGVVFEKHPPTVCRVAAALEVLEKKQEMREHFED